MPRTSKKAESLPLESEDGSSPQNTRNVLLEAAERLFAEHGFNGVSLRQIGTATGQGNTAAIQYYFGNKENLIRAVVARRAARFEGLREKQLDIVRAAGEPWEMAGLMKVFFAPFIYPIDDTSKSLSARFNLHYLMSDYRAPYDHIAAGPTRLQAFGMLVERLPFLTRDELHTRVLYMTGMLCWALVERSRTLSAGTGEAVPEEKFFSDMFSTMAMMIQVPALPGQNGLGRTIGAR